MIIRCAQTRAIDGVSIKIRGEQYPGRLEWLGSMRRLRDRHCGILFLLCLCYIIYLSDLWMVRYFEKQDRDNNQTDERTLAVVVPMHGGDVARAMESMKKWPATCSSDTLRAVDLILYHAEYVEENDLLAWLPFEASRCFRRTKVVNANLTEEVQIQ